MCWIHPTPTESSGQQSGSRPSLPSVSASSILIKCLCSPGSSALPVSPTPTPAFRIKSGLLKFAPKVLQVSRSVVSASAGAAPSPLFNMDFLLSETKVFVGSSQHIFLWRMDRRRQQISQEVVVVVGLGHFHSNLSGISDSSGHI